MTQNADSFAGPRKVRKKETKAAFSVRAPKYVKVKAQPIAVIELLFDGLPEPIEN
jgi:hypothetical protein